MRIAYRFPLARLRSVLLVAAAAALSLTASISIARADESLSAADEKKNNVSTSAEKGLAFLVQQQAPDGSWASQAGIGPSALATLAFLEHGRTPDDPVVAKGLKFLTDNAQPNGAIHRPGSRLPNYETCAVMMVLAAANKDGRYDKVLAGAEKFVRTGQWDESEQKEESDLYYGGAGYGGPSRPDLSNTAFLLDALVANGAGKDDEAIQKALIFVSRCQNLESEHNTTGFATSGDNDGGFYYTCALSEQDLSRQTDEGALRSYGSMSYNGFKSMLYAGLSKDDPRVVAVRKWISKNYSVDKNPGMGDAGLYYYYHTFSKTMKASGDDVVEDTAGQKHDWRAELAAALIDRQLEDGSWINTNTRWMEGDPVLATSFALLSLAACEPATAN